MTRSLPGIIMVLPAAVLLVLFFIVPVAVLPYAALHEFDIRMRPAFVGLQNFRDIINSVQVRNAVNVTLRLAVVTFITVVSTAFIGGLVLANVRHGGKYRSLFQIFGMLGTAANSVFWVWLFAPGWGGLAQLARALGRAPVLWHADPVAAQLACCMVLWQWLFPDNVYFVSVAASAVPRELEEAAMLDGATAWQRFRHVTMPVVRRPLAYMAVTRMAGLVQVYSVPLLLWQGGPMRATETVVMRIAQFQGGYGQAAALALLLTVAVSAMCAAAWRVGRA